MPFLSTDQPTPHSTTTRGLAVLTTRLATWHASPSTDPPPWLARARALARAGVPITLRGRVWRAFLGLDSVAVPGEYERLCADMEASDAASGGAGGGDDDSTPTDAARAARRTAWAAASASWDAQIDKDVPRTLAGHPTLAPPTKRAALRRILRAFARRCPSTGYTQGLNLVAATLLLFLGETDTFWGLTVVVADVLPDYHGPRLAAALRDARVITSAARTHLPSLAASLDAVDVDVAPVAVRWLLSGYVGCLPLETAVRVWDAALCERTPAVLLRVGVALFDVYGRALAAAADGADVLALLRDAPALTYDGSRLLDAACAGHGWLGGDALDQLRQEVEEEDAEQEASAAAPPPAPPVVIAAAARTADPRVRRRARALHPARRRRPRLERGRRRVLGGGAGPRRGGGGGARVARARRRARADAAAAATLDRQGRCPPAPLRSTARAPVHAVGGGCGGLAADCEAEGQASCACADTNTSPRFDSSGRTLGRRRVRSGDRSRRRRLSGGGGDCDCHGRRGGCGRGARRRGESQGGGRRGGRGRGGRRDSRRCRPLRRRRSPRRRRRRRG